MLSQAMPSQINRAQNLRIPYKKSGKPAIVRLNIIPFKVAKGEINGWNIGSYD